MKILLIDNSSLTPVDGTLCCEPKTGGFALELKQLGNKVTMYGQIVAQENNIHSFDIIKNNISVVGYRRNKNKLINYIFLYLMVIPQILRSDFIYIFYPSAFKYIAMLCWLLGKPYGLYVRGQNDLDSKSSKFIYKKSKAIFTVTDHFTNYIKEISSKESVFSIKPMIDLNENDICYDRKFFKKDNFKILFLARIEKDKGIEELIYAIAQLNIQNKYKFEVDVVGEGSFLKNAIELSKKNNIDNIVNFKGAIFDKNIIKEMYTQSDLYILPTYHEGFPRTLYEAMIFGIPVITSFVGGISGVMINKYNCLEIKPKSVDSILNVLMYAFSNYSEMQSYAKNSFETVKPIISSSRQTHAQHLNMFIKK